MTKEELLEVGTTFAHPGHPPGPGAARPGAYGSPGTRLTAGAGGVAQEEFVYVGFADRVRLRTRAGGDGGSKLGTGEGGVPAGNGEGSVFFAPHFGDYFSYYGGATAGKRGQAATGGRFITWVGSNPINTKGNIAA